MSNYKTRTNLLHLWDSDDHDDQKLSMRIFAFIFGISQMQRAQCGFQSLTWKRDGLFFTVYYTRVERAQLGFPGIILVNNPTYRIL